MEDFDHGAEFKLADFFGDLTARAASPAGAVHDDHFTFDDFHGRIGFHFQRVFFWIEIP